MAGIPIDTLVAPHGRPARLEIGGGDAAPPRGAESRADAARESRPPPTPGARLPPRRPASRGEASAVLAELRCRPRHLAIPRREARTPGPVLLARRICFA